MGKSLQPRRGSLLYTYGLVTVMALSASCLATPKATVYRTAGTDEMREVVANFWSKHVAEGSNVIDLDAAKDDHPYLGLGVSFPESSCYLLSRLPAEKRHAILERVWTKKGANLSVGRIHCGASDYSMHLYSYNDTPGDEAMVNFSIDADRKYVIPVIREALALQPDIYFFSSPWSPPAWMKDNNNFGGGRVLEKWYGAYANYVIRFLKEYAAEGIAIRSFTVQNEPECDQSRISPTCLWTGAEETRVIKEFLLPRLKREALSARPWLFDHNFNSTNRVERCLADEELRAGIAGVAWHSYVGTPEMILPLHRQYPQLPMFMTEMGPHVNREVRSMTWWGELLLKTLSCGCGAFVSWCLALDENGQPNISGGFPCAGFIEINSKTGAIVPSGQYRCFCHVGPFIARGACILDAPLAVTSCRWGSRQAKKAVHCAFRNPDGSHVVVFAFPPVPQGDSCDRAQVVLKKGGAYLNVQLLENSMTTVVLQ